MRIGPSSALFEKRSQIYPRRRLSYLNGVSLKNEGLGALGTTVYGITDLSCKSMRTDGLVIARTSDSNYFDFRMTCVQPGANGAPPRLVLQSTGPVGQGISGGGMMEYYRENSGAYSAWQAAEQAKIDAAKNAWYPAAQAGAPIPPDVMQQIQIFYQNPANTAYGTNNVVSITTTNFVAYSVKWNGMNFVFIPGMWSAGGGGQASLSPNVAIPLGGSPITLGGVAGAGYLFAYDPRGKIGAPGAGSQVNYTPGTGSTVAKDIGAIAAVVALPFVAAGITALAAGGAVAGAGAGAGAVMPGATAAASGATGGILATGAATTAATTAVTTGLTTAGVISAAQTAASIIGTASSAAGAVSKLSS